MECGFDFFCFGKWSRYPNRKQRHKCSWGLFVHNAMARQFKTSSSVWKYDPVWDWRSVKPLLICSGHAGHCFRVTLIYVLGFSTSRRIKYEWLSPSWLSFVVRMHFIRNAHYMINLMQRYKLPFLWKMNAFAVIIRKTPDNQAFVWFILNNIRVCHLSLALKCLLIVFWVFNSFYRFTYKMLMWRIELLVTPFNGQDSWGRGRLN